jgi:hypothetical protein
MPKPNLIQRASLLTLFALMCWGSVDAEQIYIRNRPYKGTIKRHTGGLWIEVRGLADALGVSLEEDGQGGYRVTRAQGESLTLTVETLDGVAMTPLEESSKALGARFVRNKQMDSIDVSLAPAKTSEAPAAASRPPAEAGPLAPIELNKKSPGSTVNIASSLVPGRMNIVEFGADW